MVCSMPDLEQVRGFLLAACDGRTTLDGLEATYIQAGAGGPVRVLYEVQGPNGDVLRLSARRVEASKGQRIEAAINARSTGQRSPTGFAQAALYSPALDLLFQVFPIDDRLPSLAIAAEGSAMTPILREMLGGPRARAHLQSVAVHVMRYKPERKCLLRYDLAWGADEVEPLPRVVWARVARRSKFDRTGNVLSRLYAAAGELGFDLPEPLGVVPAMAMEFFGHVPGVALFASVQHDAFPSLCRRLGEGLGRFHALPLQVEEVFDVDAQLVRLAENAA